MSSKRNYKSKSSYAPKRGGSGKVWVSLTAFVLTGAIVASVLGVGTAGFKDWSFSKWFGSNQEQTQPEEPKGEAIISETVSQGLSLMSTSIDPAAYEEYGVSAAATSAYTITATAQPAESLKEIDWSIAWKNPSSTWASGKSIATYVTYALSDDTTAATVSCSQAFGEPIVITATSATNSNAKATCQVDYLRSVQSMETSINNDVDFEAECTFYVSVTVQYGVGTVKGIMNTDCEITLDLSSTFKSYMTASTNPYLNSSIIKNSTTYSYDINKSLNARLEEKYRGISSETVNADGSLTETFITNEPDYYAKLLITPFEINFQSSQYYTYFKYAMAYATTQCTTADCILNGGSFNYIYDDVIQSTHNFSVDFDFDIITPIPSSVSSVSLNNSNLVFGI